MDQRKLPPSAPLLLLAALIAGHLAWILFHFQPAYASPDAHGYFYQARLIADTGKTVFEQDSPLQSVGIHWLITEEDQFFSRYPPGFSLFLAVLYKIGGPTAALLLNPLLTSGTVLLLFFLSRRMMDDWHALAACGILSLNTSFNAHALNAFAHTPVMFLFIAGLVLLLKWEESQSRMTAFFAGLLLGLIPTIRYPDAALGLGVIAFLALVWKKDKTESLPGIIAASAGAAIPIIGLLIRNHVAFGSPLKTGYALTNEQSGFGWSYFQNNAVNYLESLMSMGWGVLFIPSIFGIMGMLFYKYSKNIGIFLLLSILPLLLVYTAYYWSGGANRNGGLRFFLPTLPLIAFAGMWFISRIQNSLATPNWLIIASLIIIQAIIGISGTETQFARSENSAERNTIIEQRMREQIPPNSVVIIGRGAHQWIDFAGTWKLADESLISGPSTQARSFGRPGSPENNDRPSPMQAERQRKLQQRYQGLDPETRTLKITDDLEAWAGGEQIFWIGAERQIQRFLRNADLEFDWERVIEIELPEPEGISPRGNRPNFGANRPAGGPQAERGFGRGGPGGRRGPGGGLFGVSESKLALYRWIRD